jgi:hypothetical protein
VAARTTLPGLSRSLTSWAQRKCGIAAKAGLERIARDVNQGHANFRATHPVCDCCPNCLSCQQRAPSLLRCRTEFALGVKIVCLLNYITYRRKWMGSWRATADIPDSTPACRRTGIYLATGLVDRQTGVWARGNGARSIARVQAAAPCGAYCSCQPTRKNPRKQSARALRSRRSKRADRKIPSSVPWPSKTGTKRACGTAICA